MCGILIEVDSRNSVCRENFEKALDTLYHRGPDGRGSIYAWNDSVALGHRRLSIIDLSERGKQPMANEDGAIHVTYNGEIYNNTELRDQLKDKHTFFSHTDTETLVHGYEEWGMEGLLQRLNGMFAFAILDMKKRRLFLARDRAGIKPIYYEHGQGRFAAASEPKALNALKSTPLKLTFRR